jgi:hypothetical protein
MPTSRGTRKAYEHGDVRTVLTPADADQILRQQMAEYQRTTALTASYYANARVARGLTEIPQYILSDYRFRDHGFAVSWMPPRPGGYRLTKKGVIRPWLFVAFHCFGGSFDIKFLRKHRGAISVPTDENGHSPRRFMAAMRYLTFIGSGAKQVGIHFGISRKGDFVSSVDLNDVAHATGGVIPFPFSKNSASIGFEFETHEARIIYGTNKPTQRIYRQPYSNKQIMSLAIGLKKINAWRRVIAPDGKTMEPWLTTPNEILRAYQAGTGGMIQHFTVSPATRTDAGAQFNARKGEMIRFGSDRWNGINPDANPSNGPGPELPSGWDTLEKYFREIRDVKPETQVFKAPLTSVDLQLARASEVVGLVGGGGRGIAARTGRDRLAALSRSAQMQQQTRGTLYNKAAATNVALAAVIGKSSGVVSSVLQKFDASGVEGVSGAVMFNEATGLWEDGVS